MATTFERVVRVQVGREAEIFSVHAGLMAKHSFYFASMLTSAPDMELWNLPTVAPRSFHLLLDYIYGGPLTLSWANEHDRQQLVDAYLLGAMVGANRFCNTIIEGIANNAMRPGLRKILPDSNTIASLYIADATQPDTPIRRLFVDLYVHFADVDATNTIIMGQNRLPDFWNEFSEVSRSRDEHDTAARLDGNPLLMFNPVDYFINETHFFTPEPIPVSRAGTKAWLCHYDGVNTIIIEDGKPPMYIHRELSELRQDILRKCPPHDIIFPAGYRNAAIIFFKWLYFGSVTAQCYDLKDFIRAYNVGTTMHNPQFLDDLITGIVSYCTRNHILPSASEIALTYQTTAANSPLRHFMVSWTLTHRHTAPLNPSSLPMDPALCATFAADLETERASRTASMNADMAEAATHHEYGYEHPRPYADEQFGGDTPLGGTQGAAPYFGDDICRLHVAHPYRGYRAPLANADRDVNGGLAGPALDEGDAALRMFRFSTKVKESESAMRSTAATGWVHPGNDIAAKNGVRNPCYELLRKRNCYGALVVGYRPVPLEELELQRKLERVFGHRGRGSGGAAKNGSDEGSRSGMTAQTSDVQDARSSSISEETDTSDDASTITPATYKGKGKAKATDDDLDPLIANDPDLHTLHAETEQAHTAHLAQTIVTAQQTPREHIKQPITRSLLTALIAINEHRPFPTSGRSTPYESPISSFFTAGFPEPQAMSGTFGGPDEPVGSVAAFNALRLPFGWQQRRCVDGRAYFVRFIPGMKKEATWVDPRGEVVWRRSDEMGSIDEEVEEEDEHEDEESEEDCSAVGTVELGEGVRGGEEVGD